MSKQALLFTSITLSASLAMGQTNEVPPKTEPVKQDLLAQALDIALEVDDDWTQPKLVREVANQYTSKGQSDRAFAAVERIEGNGRKARAYLETSDACHESHPEVASELLGRATKLTQQVEDGDTRATLYSFIGSNYFNIDLRYEAIETLTHAAESAETVSDDFKSCQHMSRIAACYARAGQTNEFEKVQNRCLEMAASMDESFSKVMVLSSVAKNYATLGQEERYEAIIRNIQGPEQQGAAWNLVTLQLADNGYLNRALQTSERITLPSSKNFALSRIAYQEAKQGNWEQALELADRIETPKEKARALTELAILSAEKKVGEQAIALLDDALLITENIKDTNERDNVLYLIINALNSTKQADRAAVITVRLENTSYYQHALANIAISHAQAGSFKKAFNTVEQLDHPMMKARALLGIAEAQTADPASATATLELALKENEKVEQTAFQVTMLVKADKILSSQQPTQEE